MPGVKPPEPNGEDDEDDPLLDELPRDDEDEDRPLDAILIFGFIAVRAISTDDELLPLMSATRTVRFAARASSSMD